VSWVRETVIHRCQASTRLKELLQVTQYYNKSVSKYVSREFIQRIKCDNSNVLYVLVLSKQTSFKQTSETVSAKRRITQIITQSPPVLPLCDDAEIRLQLLCTRNDMLYIKLSH